MDFTITSFSFRKLVIIYSILVIYSKENVIRLRDSWNLSFHKMTLIDSIISNLEICLKKMNEQSIHDIDFGLYSADDTKENSIELLYYLFSTFFIQITKNGISSTSLQKYLSFYFQYPNYNSSLQCNFY